MGASISRLQRAGGNYAAARAQLQSEIDSGAKLSGDQRALYQRDPEGFFTKYLNQTTKGKYHGVLGKIGKVVEKVAPIAALAIPGLGPVASAAIAAGGSAAGRLAQGKSVNVGSELLTGAGAYAGNKLLKGQGVKALIGNPGAAAPAAGAAGAIPGAPAAGGNILDRALGWAGKHPLDAAQLALAGVGTLQGAQRAGQADTMRSGALASVDPNAHAAGLPSTVDPSNPYGAPVPYNRARRAALASLTN